MKIDIWNSFMPKKINFNVPVDGKTAEMFEQWHEKLPGQKGEKLTGALKAIMAIYSIDGGLAYKMMDNSISIEQAKTLLLQGISDAELIRFLASLDPSAKAQLLATAKQAKESLSRKH